MKLSGISTLTMLEAEAVKAALMGTGNSKKSYRELAREKGIVGKDGEPLPGTVHRIVQGDRNPSLSMIKKLTKGKPVGPIAAKLVDQATEKK
jgi:transcriptional regulator with XRE-family HTH domain